MKEFAERLKQLQKEMGITQKELAQRLGLSQATMSAYIRNAKTPALDVACDIAKKLNVSIGWLCGEPEASYTLLTYADLLRVLVKIIDTNFIKFCSVYNNESAELSKLIISDSIVYSFLNDRHRYRQLLEKGTINCEMYDAWMEKRISSYEHAVLPGRLDSELKLEMQA